MFCSGILPNDKDRLGQVKIFEGYCSLAHADGFTQCRPTRFVAHVRAVWKVVCAELPHEELVQKRCFITGAPGRIENCFIWLGGRVQFVGNQGKSLVPAYCLVVICVSPKNHRMSDSSLGTQPLIRLLREIQNAPAVEKLRRDAFRRSLVSYVLGSVFAELCMRAAAVRFRPRTTGTINSAKLVQLQKSPCTAQYANLSPGAFGSLHDRRHTSCNFADRFDLNRRSFFRRLRSRHLRLVSGLVRHKLRSATRLMVTR